MRPLNNFVAIAALHCAICIAHAAAPVRDGLTPATAIVMRGDSRTFDDAAFAIIRQRYPDAKRIVGRAVTTSDGGHFIGAVTVSTASHGQRTMYFDITHVN